MHLHAKILFLLILGICLLASTIQAQTPDLIGVGNIANGDIKSGVFEIDGVIIDPEAVNKVAVKVGNGPWANVEGIGTWKYTIDSRQIVTGSSYTYDSVTGKLLEHYQLGPYYGTLNIMIGAFDANGNQVATKKLTINIVPEPPYSDIVSGTYNSPLNVILKTAPGLSIYYTLDGTDPKVNGSFYGSPIYVAQSSIINAVAKNNNNQYSVIYTLNLTITGGTAQPGFTIQYYYDEALTKPLPDSPYLKAGTYYLKIISSKKLAGNLQLSIKAPGTLNNVNQNSALPLSDGVYYYPRVITADSAAIGDSQETITLSGTDVYGNLVQNTAPLNANTKTAYIDTQPPTSGSIGVEGYALSTNNPMPYFLINSHGAAKMRLALNEADLSTASWVDYASRYGGFDISNGGSGPKTVWIEFKDRAGNIQPQHVYTTVNYDNSALGFDIEYYSDPGLTHSLGLNPYLSIGTYYLKITANKDLDNNTILSVCIDAEGINNDVANQIATRITNRVFYCVRTIVNDPAAIGNSKEFIKITGITPSNTDTMAAYTTTAVLTPGVPTITSGVANQLTVSWAAVTRATAYEIWYSTSASCDSATKYGNDVTGTTCMIGGLTDGTTYYVWLKAKNSGGTSDFSPPASGTVIPDIPAPLVTGGTNQLTVSWSAVIGASAYEVWINTINDNITATKYGSDFTVTTCTITGLTNGTTYYIWLKAKNSGGSSDFSSSTNATVAPGEPGTPLVIAGTNQLTVSWPVVTGASVYEVWINTVNDNASATKYGGDVTAANCTITGLANGTTYYVWLKAKNSAGTSGISSPANGTVTPGAPGTPVIISGVGNQLTVSWTAVTGATTYEAWYNTVNDPGSATKLGIDVAGTSCNITGLTSSTTYYIWLKAKNSAGTSGFSSYASQTVIPDIPVPVVTAGTNQLTVTWTVVSGATAYEVWYGILSNNASANKFGSDVTTTSCTITGLTNGTTYYVWLKAKNNGGTTGFSSLASGTVTPGAPGTPVITSGMANQLTVSWTTVTGATAYEVWYNTVNNMGSATKFGGDIGGTSSNLTGLVSGTTYYVWLKAKNTAGTSGFSSAASQIVIPAIPLPVVTADINQLIVNWTALAGATAYEVWYNTSNNSASAIKFGNDVTAPTCTITGLAGGTNYYIWLKAKNSGGTSNFSYPVSGVPLYSGYIKGQVNFSGNGNYSVILVETNQTQTYSVSSNFSFTNLAPGNYHAKIERAGYVSVIKEITLAAGTTCDLGSMSINTLLPQGTGTSVASKTLSPSGNSWDGCSTTVTIPFAQNVSISYWLCGYTYVQYGYGTTYYNCQASVSSIWSENVWSDSGTVTKYAAAGTDTMSLKYWTTYNPSLVYITVSYLNDSEAPAVSISKTWSVSTISQNLQVAINCSDSVTGVSAVQYAVTNSMATPGSWNSTSVASIVGFPSTGVWYLHVKATDGQSNSYERVEGPYIITN